MTTVAGVINNINKGKTGGLAKKFGAANTSNKCAVCMKTVYPMEKLEADNSVYHKFCFKCTTCSRTVGLGNYAALQGKIYCKPHLKQLFKLKGNYDEGFGRSQRKADWVKPDENPVSNNPDTAANAEEEETSPIVNGVSNGVTDEVTNDVTDDVTDEDEEE